MFIWILPLRSQEPQQSPRTVCAREGGTTAHTAPEAHGSVTENTYDCDRGFPLRTIIQQLQEECTYLTLCSSKLNSPFWTLETASKLQAFLNDTFNCILLSSLDCMGIKQALAISIGGRNPGAVGKRQIFVGFGIFFLS